MARPLRNLAAAVALLGVAVLLGACGSQNINVPKSDPTLTGAQIFAQRCAGCHTLSYAGTHGSAAYVRDAQMNNGPNFDVRCERPVARVLYAIENGGFSGAIMPQNIVVGQQAREVAEFVAKYAGRGAPRVPGVPTCEHQPIGSLSVASSAANANTPSSTATTPATATTTPKKHKKHKKHKK